MVHDPTAAVSSSQVNTPVASLSPVPSPSLPPPPLPAANRGGTSVDDDAFAPPQADPSLLGTTPSSISTSTIDDRERWAWSSFDEPSAALAQTRTSSTLAPTTTSASSSHRGHDLGSRLGETLVISGGTGYNDLIGATSPSPTTYVMPISDNGGSSSEIIRTLSGPSIGDIRSRLVRLIPVSTSSHGDRHKCQPPSSNDALHALLSYRLPTRGRTKDIRAEWMDILEGKHQLWRGIESDRKEVIRGFLVHFQSEILRRAHRNFNLRGLSVGNAFLSAAQKFFRSIQSAIFLFSSTTMVSVSGASVLPCINTNHTATIAAELEDGSTLVGQCEISHPSRPIPKPQPTPIDTSTFNSEWPSRRPSAGQIFDPLANPGSDFSQAMERSRLEQTRRRQEDTSGSGRRTVGSSIEDGLDPEEEDDDPWSVAGDQEENDEEHSDGEGERGGTLGNLTFSKEADGELDALPSRIKNVFYINSYRNIVWPAPNISYLTALSRCKTLIYSCGSLWTSIVPSLALRGVATAIASSPSLKYKVLLLNTSQDRETRGYTAIDFIDAIVRSLNLNDAPHRHYPSAAEPGDHRDGDRRPSAFFVAQDYITHLVYYPSGNVTVDAATIERCFAIKCVAVHRSADALPPSPSPSSSSFSSGMQTEKTRIPKFTEEDVRWALDRITSEST